jgi:hypothetical protein
VSKFIKRRNRLKVTVYLICIYSRNYCKILCKKSFAPQGAMRNNPPQRGGERPHKSSPCKGNGVCGFTRRVAAGWLELPFQGEGKKTY